MHFAFVTLALACLAAATPARRTGGSSCNTGNVQCCQSTQSASSLTPDATKLLGLLDIPIGSVTALIGLTCTPITAVGTGGNPCTQQTVCCSNNSFNGIVALGCTPINVNL